MLAALAALALQASGLRALLVGTSRFAEGSGVRPPLGVATDLEKMKAVCQAGGEAAPAALTGPAATRGAIEGALGALAKSARSGDVCLFYYSGLGSGQKSSTGPVPSLATFDSTAKGDGGDLPVAALAKWAAAVESAGARPVLVVDACWPTAGDVSGALIKEHHLYNTTPRSLLRDRAIAGPGYAGPGTMLCAAQSESRTFDWKETDDRWTGAFTALLGGTVVDAALRRSPLSARAVYESLSRTTREYAETGYMADFRPLIVGDGAGSLLGRSPELRAQGELARLLGNEQARAKKYLVTFEVNSPGLSIFAKNALYRRVRNALAESLGDEGEVSFADGPVRPNTVVTIVEEGDKVQISMPRDAMLVGNACGPLPLESADEFVLWLRRQALLTRLYRLLDADKPTLEGELRLDFPAQGRPKDEIVATATPPGEALVLVLSRGEKLGVVQLASPHFRAGDATASPERPLSLKGLRFGGQTGAHEWRVLALRTAGPLPPLPPDAPPPGVLDDAARDKARDAFNRAAIPFLQALLKGVESGEIRWTGRVFPYTVTVNP